MNAAAATEEDAGHWPASAPETTRASVLGAMLHATIMSPSPHVRARSVGDGRRAAAPMDAAIATAASYEPAARILLTHGLHPGFMAPAAQAMVVATIAGARLGCSGPSPGG